MRRSNGAACCWASAASGCQARIVAGPACAEPGLLHAEPNQIVRSDRGCCAGTQAGTCAFHGKFAFSWASGWVRSVCAAASISCKGRVRRWRERCGPRRRSRTRPGTRRLWHAGGSTEGGGSVLLHVKPNLYTTQACTSAACACAQPAAGAGQTQCARTRRLQALSGSAADHAQRACRGRSLPLCANGLQWLGSCRSVGEIGCCPAVKSGRVVRVGVRVRASIRLTIGACQECETTEILHIPTALRKACAQDAQGASRAGALRAGRRGRRAGRGSAPSPPACRSAPAARPPAHRARCRRA